MTPLKNHLTNIRGNNWYWESSDGKAYALEHTQALYEILQKQPTITLNSDTQASEV